MKFVTHSRNDNRPPSEVVQVSKSLSVALWNVVGSNGRQRIHWKVSRVTPDGESYRLMRPEQLLEFPIALSVLAGALANAMSLDLELREKLRTLEQLMLDADSRMNANGHSNERTEANERLLKP